MGRYRGKPEGIESAGSSEVRRWKHEPRNFGGRKEKKNAAVEEKENGAGQRNQSGRKGSGGVEM